jgi:hypothetical protein
MNSDMSVTTRPQMSAQQHMRRLKNKILLRAYCNSDEMTAEEEARGCQLQLACLKKNEKQRKCNCRTAGEKMKPENVCLTVTDGCEGEKVAAVKQRECNCRTAGEKMKPENVCLTVTDGCKGETVAAVKMKALCCFEGCNNQIRAGGVCSRHGAKQIRTCSKEGFTKQAHQGEYVLLMVQRPNFAAMRDVPSRLSGEGSAKITLGLQKHLVVMQHRGVPQQRCLDKSKQSVGLQEVPLHESQWKGSMMQCQRMAKIYHTGAAGRNVPDDVCLPL